MLLDRHTTGTNRREGEMEPSVQNCVTGICVSLTPAHSHMTPQVLRLCTTPPLPSGIWSQGTRRARGSETRSQHHSKGARARKKQKGIEFPFNPLHTVHLHLCASVQPRCLFSMFAMRGHAATIALALSCWHGDSISGLKRNENSYVVKKGKNCTNASVPFSSLLSFFQSLHTHSGCDTETPGCFAATVNRASLKNSWPFNGFTFHSTRRQPLSEGGVLGRTWF